MFSESKSTLDLVSSPSTANSTITLKTIKISEIVKNTTGLISLYIVSQIVGITSVVLTFIWCLNFRGGFGFSGLALSSWHPFFMSLGLIYLMGNAIVTFRVFRNNSKRKLKLLHASLNGVVLVLTILAGLAMLVPNVLSNASHLYTLHGWVGLIAITLLITQSAVAVLLYFCNGVRPSIKSKFLPYHVYFGHIIFGCGIMSALLGLTEKAIWKLGDRYSDRGTEAWLYNVIGLLFLIFWAIVVHISRHPPYKRETQ